jgi:hypothetical protein
MVEVRYMDDNALKACENLFYTVSNLSGVLLILFFILGFLRFF